VIRQVAHNAGWNVAGNLTSVAVGLIALPVLLHALGPSRLGIFTLALGLIGFSGLLDLGLGRSLTQSVSASLGRGRPREAVAALVWHVLRLLAGFGVIWLLILWLSVPWIVSHLFSLRGGLGSETVFGLRAVAVSMPFALVGTGAMGALEGLQCFRQVSVRRSALSVLQFGLPTLVVLWRADLGLVIAALALSRGAGLLVWLDLLRQELALPHGKRSDPEDLRHLLLSVSNLVGPMMVYADRFYLATLFPPATVAYYAVPYDALSRVNTLPSTAIGALFPALAEAQARPGDSTNLVRSSTLALTALMLPPLLLASIFAKFLLTIWLGRSFALSALPIFHVLLLGVFINSAAQIPYALLQAHGRSDLTAKLHLLELPVFAGMLIWFVSLWGVVGAAWAWMLRVALDGGALYGYAMGLAKAYRRNLAEMSALVAIASCALVMPLLTDNSTLLAVLALFVSTFCAFTLFYLFQRWRGSFILVSSK
jgi:O-antigen/teichoic acid export membrane protein